MEKILQHLIVGISPFSLRIAQLLRQSGQLDFVIFSDTDIFGGVWQNINFENKIMERFPHAIEFETEKDLDILKNIFNLNFVKEKKNLVCFWIDGKKYYATSRLHCLQYAFHEFMNVRSLSRLKRSLRHVLNQRKYCIPVGGFKEIEGSIERQFKLLNCKIIKERVLEIESFKKFVSVKTTKSQYKFNTVHLPRGLSEVLFYVKKNEFRLKKSKLIVTVLINGNSTKLARYNKFYSGLIDRISSIGDRYCIVQSRIGIQNIISEELLMKEVKQLELFEGKIYMINSWVSTASSFNLNDKEFRNFRNLLPKNVRLYDSKAFSNLLNLSI